MKECFVTILVLKVLDSLTIFSKLKYPLGLQVQKTIAIQMESILALYLA